MPVGTCKPQGEQEQNREAANLLRSHSLARLYLRPTRHESSVKEVKIFYPQITQISADYFFLNLRKSA